jgi:hypothetical protein
MLLLSSPKGICVFLTGVSSVHADRASDWALSVLFNSLENDEPPHIPVERDDDMANTGWNRLHSLQITVFGLTN